MIDTLLISDSYKVSEEDVKEEEHEQEEVTGINISASTSDSNDRTFQPRRTTKKALKNRWNFKNVVVFNEEELDAYNLYNSNQDEETADAGTDEIPYGLVYIDESKTEFRGESILAIDKVSHKLQKSRLENERIALERNEMESRLVNVSQENSELKNEFMRVTHEKKEIESRLESLQTQIESSPLSSSSSSSSSSRIVSFAPELYLSPHSPHVKKKPRSFHIPPDQLDIEPKSRRSI